MTEQTSSMVCPSCAGIGWKRFTPRSSIRAAAVSGAAIGLLEHRPCLDCRGVGAGGTGSALVRSS